LIAFSVSAPGAILCIKTPMWSGSPIRSTRPEQSTDSSLISNNWYLH